MWIIVVIFMGVTGITIGFALWDRRTMSHPFETKVKEIEQRITDTENLKIKDFFKALKEYSKTQPKLAELLNTYGLL